DELAEVRRLGLVELSGTILRWKSPDVRRCAYEAANRIAIIELKEIHYDDFIDDSADFAWYLRAFHLEAVLDEAVEVVDNLFKDEDEDHVLDTQVLQLRQPHQHFARMQAVSAAQVLSAGALRARLRLLLRRSERQPIDGRDAVNEKRVIAVKVLEPSPDTF